MPVKLSVTMQGIAYRAAKAVNNVYSSARLVIKVTDVLELPVTADIRGMISITKEISSISPIELCILLKDMWYVSGLPLWKA